MVISGSNIDKQRQINDNHVFDYILDIWWFHRIWIPQTIGFPIDSNQFWMILGYPIWKPAHFFIQSIVSPESCTWALSDRS